MKYENYSDRRNKTTSTTNMIGTRVLDGGWAIGEESFWSKKYGNANRRTETNMDSGSKYCTHEKEKLALHRNNIPTSSPSMQNTSFIYLNMKK